MVWIEFILCSLVILYSGNRVAKYGDTIAAKTGLGGLWIGVMLLAIATSLPELFTGIGSTVFLGSPDLSIGNLLGSNTYNLFNIALLDFLNKEGPILSCVSTGQLLTCVLSLAPLMMVAVGLFLGPKILPLSWMNISIYSLAIVLTYIFCSRIIFHYGQKHETKAKKKDKKENGMSLKRAVMLYVIFAAIVGGAGVWLSYIGDDISKLMKLEQNFVGNLFLGFATTLPEMTVSITALSMGAQEMAVANLVGSNLFNMTIIAVNDVFYQKGPIFGSLSQKYFFNIFVIILMTIIVSEGLISKPQKKTRMKISGYSIALIVVFVVGNLVNFLVSK